MSRAECFSSASTSSAPCPLDTLEERVPHGQGAARGIGIGLPALGLVVSLFAGLLLFAALTAACFLFATAVVCRKALVGSTGQTLRLLVTARLVVLLVLAAMLVCAGESARVAVVSALLLWLTADRLLGRRALDDLSIVTRPAQ